MMLKFMEIKSHELKITQKQFSKQLEVPDSTIKRYRDDIYMNSPYKRKKNTKKNTTNTKSEISTPKKVKRTI